MYKFASKPFVENVLDSMYLSTIDYHFGMDLIVRRPQQIQERVALGDSFLREITEKGKVLYARAD